ncbi:MAG: hydroxyquinol 1,2-dioxygenase [Candidatus Lambdaproteobacteria bacterium]|nr:hydroxyquinol 1,2-dioxygenase [Candidatus Lambdaproteobacteria bacterium]
MRNLNADNIEAAVLSQLGGTRDPRLKAVLNSLIPHLMAFVREVRPTEEEWLAALAYLTDAGKRDEYILLSDILGVTMQVDALLNPRTQGVTETSVLGPFYREQSPLLEAPADVARGWPGEPVVISGRVCTPRGEPIAGALLDVWQTAPNGLYENQDPQQPEMNLRGRLRSGADGRYALRTVKPVSYPISTGGPGGRLLRAMGRHPFRPAHVHFKVSASGFRPLTTQLFVEGDPYLDSDAVFGVKNQLVVEFVRHEQPAEVEGHRLPAPYYTVRYDFGMQPSGA